MSTFIRAFEKPVEFDVLAKERSANWVCQDRTGPVLVDRGTLILRKRMLKILGLGKMLLSLKRGLMPMLGEEYKLGEKGVEGDVSWSCTEGPGSVRLREVPSYFHSLLRIITSTCEYLHSSIHCSAVCKWASKRLKRNWCCTTFEVVQLYSGRFRIQRLPLDQRNCSWAMSNLFSRPGRARLLRTVASSSVTPSSYLTACSAADLGGDSNMSL